MHRFVRPLLAALLTAAVTAVPSLAEEFTVASYNIENFHTNFSAFHMKRDARKNPITDPAEKAKQDALISAIDLQNQEDQWEIAATILDPAFFPDILMIQEGPLQSDLEYFNRRWLEGKYETVLQLPTTIHPDRPQTLAVMLKPGFKIIDKKDQYYLEEDTVPNGRNNRLFARGPSFLKVQTPSGYEFWVGNTHQKSKGIRLPPVAAVTQPTTQAVEDDDAAAVPVEAASQPESESRSELRARMEKEANDWRMREAVRTHAIIKEIEAEGPTDVMIVGDMNDDWGMDKNEKLAGKDGIAELVGPPEAGLFLVTQPLIDQKAISYGGYWRPRYRSLIDHAVATNSMKDQIVAVSVFNTPMAAVASDHYPVIVKIKSDPVPAAGN